MISVASPAGQGEAERTAPTAALELARRVLAIESEAVRALIARLEERFLQAVELILACRSSVVVSVIGRSGHVASKIAATDDDLRGALVKPLDLAKAGSRTS